MGDDPSGTTASILSVLASAGLLVGSTLATLMYTGIHQDKMTGSIYMSTVTASMGLINLETPLMLVDYQLLTLEDVINLEMAEIHPQ